MEEASERPKISATFSASEGAILAMIIDWCSCTGTPRSLSDRRLRPGRTGRTLGVRTGGGHRPHVEFWAATGGARPRNRLPSAGAPDPPKGAGSCRPPRPGECAPLLAARAVALPGYEPCRNPGRGVPTQVAPGPAHHLAFPGPGTAPGARRRTGVERS